MCSVGCYEDIDESAEDSRVHEYGTNDAKRFNWTSVDRPAAELEPAVQKEQNSKGKAKLWRQIVTSVHAR